jgi:hypothetical protein
MFCTSVLAGYTLNPVPEWAQKMFDNNNYVKYIILCFVGLVCAHPIKDNTTFALVFLFPIVLLFAFEQARLMDNKKKR